MSLVNWKELKSSDRQTSFKTRVWILLSPLFLAPNSALAEAKTLSDPTSIVSIFLSLLLVIAVVFMLAFIMRRFNVTGGSTGQLKVVASLAAGPKERVLVIDVGGEQHLIGVTAQSINHLAKLDNPIANDKPPSGENFKDKLSLFMAGKLQPTANSGAKKSAGERDE
ncbi:flagellar biosynthetic protein FliO [Paraglaciecola sp. L1A13]|uniref:flagellar biosynthetic protein FliO n=1 Tax=Paraglaciecola sp. L1A13 TaxID=2686359 RepID=UPI00131B101C|nr:flagellar biosynthetic protein FliO [Paraglaciecola sp. L1A13]